MNIQRITNENKDVEEKMNYFIDRYTHFLEFAGTEIGFELENQLSLLQKLDFQLTNDNEYRLEYIDNYLKHPLFKIEELWEPYKSFKTVEKQLKLYLIAESSSKDKKGIKDDKIRIVDSSFFQQDLKNLIIELKHRMPDVLHRELLSVIQCQYPLNEDNHIHKLNLLVQLIVSAGFFTGKKNIEISELIDRIFNKNKAFPFPPQVKTKAQKASFLSKRSLSDQIGGFSSIMREDHLTGIIIMRLYGGKFPEDFNFEYDGVHFLGHMNPRIIKVKESINKEQFSRLFTAGDYIFACVKLKWFSYKSVALRMKSATNNQIKYLSSILGREFNLDYTNNYVITDSKWKFTYGSWSTRKFDNVPSEKLEFLPNNAIKILSRYKSYDSTHWFHSLEPMFLTAMKYTSMPDYWMYLEALLSYNNKKKQIKEIVTSLLLLSEERQRKERILNTLSVSLSLFYQSGSLNISHKEYISIEKALVKGNIKMQIREIRYAFVQELVNEFDTIINSKTLKEAKDFYYGILIEAYGNRNFFVHKGFNNNTVVIKLEKTLPLIVARIRWLLIEEIKAQPQLPFDLLLEDLVIKANKLLVVH